MNGLGPAQVGPLSLSIPNDGHRVAIHIKYALQEATRAKAPTTLNDLFHDTRLKDIYFAEKEKDSHDPPENDKAASIGRQS